MFFQPSKFKNQENKMKKYEPDIYLQSKYNTVFAFFFLI